MRSNERPRWQQPEPGSYVPPPRPRQAPESAPNPPAPAPEAVRAPGPTGALGGALPPLAVPPPRGPRLGRGALAVVVGGGAALLAALAVVVPFLLRATGSSGLLVGFLLSLFPLAIVLLAVFAVDRWEPEPRRLIVLALVWGAVMSVAATTLVQPVFLDAFGPRSGAAQTMRFLATVEAPMVEESAKGLGLLILMLAARKYVDGPVDGIVYGMTIAAGFAFTENILYFGRLFSETSGSAASLAVVFTMRGVLSPFAHAMFTGTLGLVMGLAARRWSPGLVVGAFLVGLAPAMLLHNIWNSGGEDFFFLYVLVQIPLFGAATVGVYFLRRAEARLTHERLLEYAQAGWFSPLEVEMLATPRGRSAGLKWATGLGRGTAMRAFIRTATDLAAARQRALSGRDVRGYAASQQELLDRIGRERDALLGMSGGRPRL
ncbi:PrsW family intramembrane metalloprotease [Sinomonas atrocyanea]|uniref:PrsW family intramembrane metalloprotease n=1 Tax=Sinomonas atrocyanea TaxID=37927 RepID=UPI002780400E|nr:PrsW family intramembrane metalloprotease [Sinomonas atrocyanea]MDQ0261839.1 RsiW-degrading membrane proteinase PrsW (M82 family) [Sinomonas atrocyanea]MDR6623576.1 RsiW-degrading membrane proteinase PrsW (M82 family) [Sinomonas atrocyanea]